MSVSFKAKLLSAITNAAYISKTTADIALAKLGLSDSNPSNNSGAAIDNTQKFINQLADSSGETENDANRKIYSSNNFISDGDSRKVAIGKLDAQSLVNANGIQAINDSIGQPDGIAPLDSSGLVPSANLPSFVDDVLEFADLASFPVTGETGKIYVALDTGRIYRWSGSIYVEISQSPVDSVNSQTGTVVLDNTDIGLGNVTNDAQLKRAGADFDTFTEKVTPVVDDIVLIEDSEDSFNKKKAKLSNLLGGGGGGGLDTYYTNDFESFLVSDIQETGNGAYASNPGGFSGDISPDTVDIIAGDQSYRYTAGAASNGDYFIIDSVNIRDREKSVSNARSIWIDATNFNNDFNIIIYDQSNSSVLKSQTVLAGTPLKEYLIEFIPTSTTDIINFGFEMPTAVDTEYFVWDNIEFTVDPFVYASLNEENEFAAIIQNNGAASLISEGAEFIDSVTRVGVGVVTINFKPGFFTQIPSVTATGLQNTGVAPILASVASSPALTANEVTIEIVNTNTGTFVDRDIFLNVSRQGADYKTLSDNAAIPSKSNMFDTQIFNGIDIVALGSPLTKPPTTNDRLIASRSGQFLDVTYQFDASGTGVAGTGDYTIGIPTVINGEAIEVDTDLIGTFSGALGLGASDSMIGYGTMFTTSGPAARLVHAYLYSANSFRIGDRSSGNIFGQFYAPFSQTVSFSVTIRVPIKGWTSENQFLSLIPVQKTAFITYEEANTVTGDSIAAGSFGASTLNNIQSNDTGITINANQITIPPGTWDYEMYIGFHQATAAGNTGVAKLVRDPNGTPVDEKIGTSVAFSNNGGGQPNGTYSVIKGRVILNSPTEFQVEQRAVNAGGRQGRGTENFGVTNVGHSISITKVK